MRFKQKMPQHNGRDVLEPTFAYLFAKYAAPSGARLRPIHPLQSSTVVLPAPLTPKALTL